MPLVLLEADRSDNDRGAAKAYDWDELKPLFNGGTLGVTGVKTAGNETYEPPFRGTIVISQNATVMASEAILTRIVKLHFVRPEVTAASRAAADNLNHLSAMDVSHFLLMAARAEGKVLETFRTQVKVHEQAQHAGAQRELVAMALARQTAVNADPAEVAEFWEAFDYLQGLSEDPVVDHSKKPDVIAVNLNEFCERAAEHRQKIADIGTLRTLLPNSRSRKYLMHNKGVDSAVRAAFNRRNQCSQRGTTVKCWLFQNPERTER
jgi:hypothetical protein